MLQLACALKEERLQSSLHLQKKLEELRREVDLLLKTEKEKSQALLSELRLKVHNRVHIQNTQKCSMHNGIWDTRLVFISLIGRQNFELGIKFTYYPSDSSF